MEENHKHEVGLTMFITLVEKKGCFHSQLDKISNAFLLLLDVVHIGLVTQSIVTIGCRKKIYFGALATCYDACYFILPIGYCASWRP
jgi:hypothetical protein